MCVTSICNILYYILVPLYIISHKPNHLLQPITNISKRHLAVYIHVYIILHLYSTSENLSKNLNYVAASKQYLHIDRIQNLMYFTYLECAT